MTETQKVVETAVQKSKGGKGRPAKSKTMVGMRSNDIESLFKKYRPQIASALPRHLTAKRIIQMYTVLIAKNPALQECTAESVIGSLMQSSILGFKPVESLGQCYIIPYNSNIGPREAPQWVKQAQFQIGYKGYIDLAQRSGKIKMLFAYAVYEGDDFKYQLGLHPNVYHVPKIDDREKVLTFAYAVAHYTNGGFNFVVLTRDQIEKLRLRNRDQQRGIKGAWKTDYPEMACAKAIKKLAKFMPMSDEIHSAVMSDEIVITPGSFTNDASGTIKDAAYEVIEDDPIQVPSEEKVPEISPEANDPILEHYKKAAKVEKLKEVPMPTDADESKLFPND